MTDKELQVFLEGTVNYFLEVSGTPAVMGVPYIKETNEEVSLDLTGAIGISGNKKGVIYITCPSAMVKDLVGIILGDKNPDSGSLCDMTGEIANTIAGNARQVFGANFMISVPIIIEGKPVHLKVAAPTFVIPITWRSHKSFLVVGIES